MTPSKDMHKILVECYLDYLNNYLTVETWALDNGLTEKEGHKVIALGRVMHGFNEEL